MKITINSVTHDGSWAITRATAIAEYVVIEVTARFLIRPSQELDEQARDEILRYLDPM